MLSKEQATEMVQQLLGNIKIQDDSVVIANTIEREYGWIFFYQSKKRIETGEVIYSLAGNGPIIVNKHNGDVVRCGTSGGFQSWIEDYEKTLGDADPSAEGATIYQPRPKA